MARATGLQTFVFDGDDVRTVHLCGELDVAGAPALREALVGEARRVDVDLSGLSFIDARGVGLLVAARARAANLGRRLRLRNPSGRVRWVFELSSLGPVLEE